MLIGIFFRKMSLIPHEKGFDIKSALKFIKIAGLGDQFFPISCEKVIKISQNVSDSP